VALTAGLLCYALASYLSKPVKRLNQATRQLAQGDLNVRVSATMSQRQDELADLARNFDVMAARIQALMGAQRALLSNVSHELRSPLARLNVALGLARQRSGPEAGAALDRIERESEILNTLIGQLLELSRLESGPVGGAMTRVDLAGIVREVAADAEFEALSRNRKVSVKVEEPCEIVGVADVLRSALENIVRNAVTYTAENTEVEVVLSRRNDGDPVAVLSVRDHGPGVPESALKDLFRPFYRVDNGGQRQANGTGLGMAIAEHAVRAHKGRVTAANAAEGGLIVEAVFPLITKDAS
jgi:two-component system sensor histidine kinase CpxA